MMAHVRDGGAGGRGMTRERGGGGEKGKDREGEKGTGGRYYVKRGGGRGKWGLLLHGRTAEKRNTGEWEVTD